MLALVVLACSVISFHLLWGAFDQYASIAATHAVASIQSDEITMKIATDEGVRCVRANGSNETGVPAP